MEIDRAENFTLKMGWYVLWSVDLM